MLFYQIYEIDICSYDLSFSDISKSRSFYFCYFHVTYAYQRETTLCSCLNTKEFVA